MPRDYNSQGPVEIDDSDLSGPKIDRRTAVQLLGSTGLLGLAGCTGDPANEGGNSTNSPSAEQQVSGSKKSGGRLSAGWYAPQATALNIPQSGNIDAIRIGTNVMSALLRFNPDLSIRGDLATDWTVDQESNKITFQLREGVTFHNGDSFTAEDVKYTIRAFQQEGLTRGAGKVEYIKPVDEGGVVAVNDHTVEFNFTELQVLATFYMTRIGGVGVPMNKRAREEMGASNYKTKPVGTGPFKVKDHVAGSSVTLDRFEEYYQTDDEGNQLPYLEGVDIQMIPEPASVSNAIRGGDVDFIQSVPVDQFSSLKKKSDIKVNSTAGPNWRGLGFNFAKKPFTDPRVREAIARGIDKEKWVKQVFFSTAVRASGPISPATGWAWRPHEEKPNTQSYDPERAKQLLTEAGVEGLETSITAAPSRQRHARFIKNQLSQIGVNVSINILPSSQYSKEVEENRDFDIIFPGTGGDFDPSPTIFPVFHESGWLREMSYAKSEDYEKAKPLLEKQRVMFNREKRKEVLWELEDLLISGVGSVFLSHRNDMMALRPTVKGYQVLPTLRDLHTVWLDK